MEDLTGPIILVITLLLEGWNIYYIKTNRVSGPPLEFTPLTHDPKTGEEYSLENPVYFPPGM